ncbi:15592_t:CDS:1, partial [Acaulospora morrowiae]
VALSSASGDVMSVFHIHERFRLPNKECDQPTNRQLVIDHALLIGRFRSRSYFDRRYRSQPHQ